MHSPDKIGARINRTSIRDFSVRLSFENQAWHHATPVLWSVLVEVGDFNGSDEVVNDFYRVSDVSVNFLLFVDKHLVYKRSQYLRRQFFEVAVFSLLRKQDKNSQGWRILYGVAVGAPNNRETRF